MVDGRGNRLLVDDDLILSVERLHSIRVNQFLLCNNYGKHNKIDIGMFLSYFKNEIKIIIFIKWW